MISREAGSTDYRRTVAGTEHHRARAPDLAPDEQQVDVEAGVAT
jgi:hypothetical protein